MQFKWVMISSAVPYGTGWVADCPIWDSWVECSKLFFSIGNVVSGFLQASTPRLCSILKLKELLEIVETRVASMLYKSEYPVETGQDYSRFQFARMRSHHRLLHIAPIKRFCTLDSGRSSVLFRSRLV